MAEPLVIHSMHHSNSYKYESESHLLTDTVCMQGAITVLESTWDSPNISILIRGLAGLFHIWGYWAIPPLQQAGTHCRGVGGEGGVSTDPITLLTAPQPSSLSLPLPFF